MTLSRWLAVTGLVCLGCTFALPVVRAQEAPATQPVRPLVALVTAEVRGVREIVAELNLTPEQKSKLKTVAENAKTKFEAWRKQHEADLEKLRGEFKAARESKDPAKIKQLREDLKTLWETRPKILPEIKAVLTPEQQSTFETKFKELQEKIRERIRERLENAIGAT